MRAQSAVPSKTKWRSPRHFDMCSKPRFSATMGSLSHPSLKCCYVPGPSPQVWQRPPGLPLLPSRRPLRIARERNPLQSSLESCHHGWATDSKGNIKGAQWLGDPNCYNTAISRPDFVKFSGYVWSPSGKEQWSFSRIIKWNLQWSVDIVVVYMYLLCI